MCRVDRITPLAFWKRLGESRIVAVKNLTDSKDARIFANDILAGDKVLAFFDTPYGLVGLGEGAIGLIETEESE